MMLCSIFVIIFFLHNYAFCVRKAVARKSGYMIFAAMFAIGAVGLCLYMIIVSIEKPGYYDPFWFEDIFILGLIVLVVLVTAWTKRKTKIRTVYFGCFASFFTLVISLVVCEAALRAFYFDRIVEISLPPAFLNDAWMKSGSILTGTIPSGEELDKLRHDNVTISEHFYFNDNHVIPSRLKKKNDKRVMWLGDSTTEASGVAQRDNFVSLLEKNLNMPNYNFGVAGTSTDFQKAIFDRFFDIVQPDAVFLGFYPLNDCREFGSQYSQCGFSSLYSPEGKGFRYNCNSESLPIFAKIFSQPPDIMLRFLARKTSLGMVFLNARLALYAGIAKRFYFKPNPFQMNKDSMPPYIDNSEDICNMINELNRDVLKRGAVFGVVMIPYPENAERMTGEFGSDVCYLPDKCAAAMLNCMKHSEIPFLNVHGAFSDAELRIRSGKNIFISDQDTHLSEKGHEAVEKLVAPFARSIIENN